MTPAARDAEDAGAVNADVAKLVERAEGDVQRLPAAHRQPGHGQAVLPLRCAGQQAAAVQIGAQRGQLVDALAHDGPEALRPGHIVAVVAGAVAVDLRHHCTQAGLGQRHGQVAVQLLAAGEAVVLFGCSSSQL